MDKKKLITYTLAIVLPMVILAFVLAFAVKSELAYAIAYEVLALECCFQIVGIVWHWVKKTFTVKVIASKVWFTFLIGASIGIIVTESWAMVGFLAGIAMVGLVNWIGFRYIIKDDSSFMVSIKEDKVEKLANTMVYKLGEDGKPNEEEPLCIVEGVAVTPARAMEKGYVDVAKSAIAYIRTIV